MFPCRGTVVASLFLVGASGSMLPSFTVDTSKPVAQRAWLEAGDRWWVQVHDDIYHAPDETSHLSRDIGNYYYAAGSDAGLSDDLKQKRVGGQGRWHIFHIPEGISLLETQARSGDRRSSMSRLNKIASGLTLKKGFPDYMSDDSYTHPLSEAGQAKEDKAVEKVNPKMFHKYLSMLTDLPTRSWSDGHASKQAVSLLTREFKAMGYKVCEHKFKSNGQVLTNLLAYEHGRGSQAVVVGAHYDSRPFVGDAPGAVDNGSGVAGMLAMAKALKLSKVRTDKPVIFAAFAGEEAGLLGSKSFAEELKRGAQAIPQECVPTASSFLDTGSNPRTSMVSGALIMDEIGWKANTDMYQKQPTVNLESNDWTADMMQHLVASSQAHNGDSLRVVHSNNPFGSDHCSFLDLGLKSVLTIQGDDEAYPDYHKKTDRIKNVDFDYATKIVKMNMGGLLRMAGVRGGEDKHLRGL